MSDLNITVLRNNLTPKQVKFADEYIKSGNGTDAAIKAGYSKKTASTISANNLAKEQIKKYIQAVMADMSKSKIASAEEIQEMWTRCLRREEFEDVLTEDGVDKERISIKDALKASELLAKVHGILTDKQETKISGSIELQNLSKLPTETLKKLADEKDEQFDFNDK
ncbi:terminase small subunit [Apilactobacillus xinyiensis]|uniref:terminase small subunit n=1 Tax=Apilactobacillus xinyiensis TaxID=2841032 RepID=UPI00200CBCCC|nr:terminase small subunit [Apilactobacillus xinyiensis]MCL0330833.1 terminase small subunit [Apilactobacillus xinyiensis]